MSEKFGGLPEEETGIVDHEDTDSGTMRKVGESSKRLLPLLVAFSAVTAKLVEANPENGYVPNRIQQGLDRKAATGLIELVTSQKDAPLEGSYWDGTRENPEIGRLVAESGSSREITINWSEILGKIPSQVEGDETTSEAEEKLRLKACDALAVAAMAQYFEETGVMPMHFLNEEGSKPTTREGSTGLLDSPELTKEQLIDHLLSNLYEPNPFDDNGECLAQVLQEVVKNGDSELLHSFSKVVENIRRATLETASAIVLKEKGKDLLK